eukprot:CAMPEP_0201690436 /NCGR_PEP_ID=MMETSP0578-20130828/3880_1 /ASSEMBLY_ACC=CAM_ASM_000663 /TAXON_ID=267565 /ORGANISM="Skeletonema grethea, Strain CCMP 1804" /LENGTH=56 /DNA_ID=CAMNT_0048175433 /DNA_START=129 /DNA_END=296 /DNA_ORIENTATION=-
MSYTELHDILLENPTAVEQVQALIDKNPNLVKEKGEFGTLPLHYAISEGASLEVIQ